MRTIVLGHSGFVGGAVHRRLAATGAEVHGFSSAELDLRDANALSRLDGLLDQSTTLIFASALTPDKGATLEVLRANHDITFNVARYLEAHPCRKCVYLSTDAVYPMLSSPITEDTSVEPSNFNALAKYTGERMLARVEELTGLRLLVLRLTPMFGAGDTHGSYGPNQFIRTIRQDSSVRLFGGGEEQRDHLYIEDAAELIVRLAQSDVTGLLNLATGHSVSFADVVDALRRIVPKPFEVSSMPRKGAITHRHFDVSKLFLAVPDFRYTPLEEALRTQWAA